MAENRIILIDDIQEFWPVSNNIDPDKINAAILRAQQSDVKRVLGAPLYYLFIEDYNGDTFGTAIYQDLFNGTTYTYQGNTIYYTGLKQLVCTYAFIKIMDISRINVVSSGQVYKVSEESEFLEDFQARADKRRAIEEAIRLEKDTQQFLYYNRTDYPLFSQREYKENKTAYNFFKVK